LCIAAQASSSRAPPNDFAIPTHHFTTSVTLWSTANASESTLKNHSIARLSVLGSIPSTLLLFVELSACTGTAERQRQHNVIDRRESGQRGDAGMLQANSPQQRWSFPAAQHSRRRL